MPNDRKEIDETNRLILSELQDDGRLTVAELGRRVGLSSPAVAERLQRLERDGVIAGYRADIDPRALGHGRRREADAAPELREGHPTVALKLFEQTTVDLV